jgi:hypothetical protein
VDSVPRISWQTVIAVAAIVLTLGGLVFSGGVFYRGQIDLAKSVSTLAGKVDGHDGVLSRIETAVARIDGSLHPIKP